MAPGLPYAIAMQHAFPGRQVIAFVGDGGFAMLMAEFLTAVRHELPIKVVVNNNNSLRPDPVGADRPRLSRVRGAAPEPDADFAAWAAACGGFGAKVTRPGRRRRRRSTSCWPTPVPAFVDCDVNPNEPPMPGKVTYDQAKHFTEAFLRGPAAQGGHRSPRWPGTRSAAAVVTRRTRWPTRRTRPPEPPHVDAGRAWSATSRSSVDGEVRFDAGVARRYSTDASNYRQVPIGVVVPRTVEAARRGGRGLPPARRAGAVARRRYQPRRPVHQRRRDDRLVEVLQPAARGRRRREDLRRSSRASCSTR